MTYYNEFDPGAAEWLRELIRAGLIPPGDVDERSIADVVSADLVRYRSCHFFAGIGGWPYALRLAGWPDGRPIWTGSCPCQPYSSAGKGKGDADHRNLWPAMFRLVRECRPVVVFGEQVESAIGHGWLDGISGDLEGEGYAVGAAVLGAHSVGAPHIRQRLYWVAHSESGGRAEGHSDGDRCRCRACAADDGAGLAVGRRSCWLADAGRAVRGTGVADGCRVAGRDGVHERPEGSGETRPCRGDGRMADPDGGQPRDGRVQPGREHGQQPEDGGAGGGVGDAERQRVRGGGYGADGTTATGVQGEDGERQRIRADIRATGGGAGHWRAFDLIPCRDGKSRRVEPGTFPLAHGIPGRVGLLRGYGNAIVPQAAAAFIRAYLDVTEG